MSPRFFCSLALALTTLAVHGVDQDHQTPTQSPLQTELEDFSLAHWDRRPAELPPPNQDSPFIPEAGPALAQYRGHLAENGSWGEGPVWHQMGRIPLPLSNQDVQNLAVNVFQPRGTSKGTLMFLHGYMAHAGDFGYTLAWFASRGWTVVTLDLPGHGISEGRRSDIDDFAQYGDAVGVWMNWVLHQGWPGPRVLLAHSLGAAAALEALRRPNALCPDQVIFCAPLLRTAWYPALSIADLTLGGMVSDFSKLFGSGSSAGYAATIHWFHALGVWLWRLDYQKPLDLPLTIYSGDNDTVVDAGWNRWKFRQLVPAVVWVTLAGKGHWFLSSSQDREAFHERLMADLDAKLAR